MAILNSYLKSIADAIRSKKGTTEPINAKNFADEINNLPLGEVRINAFGYAGTPIPSNGGYLEKLYINKELTIEEVVTILSKITLVENNDKKMILLFATGTETVHANSKYIYIYHNEMYGYYMEYTYGQSGGWYSTLIFSQYEQEGLIGWKTDFPSMITVNDNLLPNGFTAKYHCKETDKLTALFSTSEITYSEELDRTIKLSGEYVGNIVNVTENQTIDVEDMLDQNMFPLRINVNVQSISSGVPVEVATASEMDALLVTDNIGKIYKYTGVSNDTYTNGNLYIIENM